MNQKRKLEDEIKFKELFKSPLRLFGWVYPYFFLLIVAFGIYFGHQIITISFNEVPVGVPDSANVKTKIVEKKGGVTPAVDLASIQNPTPQMISKGKELFDANCQSCHGADGRGDGPAGAVLNPKPRNYHDTTGWTNGRTIDEMYKTLQEGIVKNGMASYEYIPPSDRLDIILYIRTFAKFPDITDDQLNSMNNTYNLSEGVVTPNQIPVSKAEQILEEENSVVLAKVKAAKEKLLHSSMSPGLSLLRSSSDNIDKVIKSFIDLGTNTNFDRYYVTVADSPIMQGYSPRVLQFNKEQWKTLYDYLKYVAS